jgi:hypothetical protein
MSITRQQSDSEITKRIQALLNLRRLFRGAADQVFRAKMVNRTEYRVNLGTIKNHGVLLPHTRVNSWAMRGWITREWDRTMVAIKLTDKGLAALQALEEIR